MFRRLFRKKKDDYLDLTKSKEELPFDVGLKSYRAKLKAKQKVGIVLMIINVGVPFTFWPVTNPIIWKYMIK